MSINVISKLGRRGAICLCNRCNVEYTVTCKYSAKRSDTGDLCDRCKHYITDMGELTQKKLLTVLKYDEATGILSYRHKYHRKAKGARADIELFNSKSGSKYRGVKVSRKTHLAHRVIYLMQTGTLPLEVDHIDHDRSNNRWLNLRPADKKLNSYNHSLSKNSTTGVTGVSYNKARSNFRAYIVVDNKQINLGSFKTLKKARKARLKANVKYGFHKNHGKVNVTN